MNVTVGKTLFKNRASHLATFESGPTKTEVNYCLIRRNERKFFQDMKVLPSGV